MGWKCDICDSYNEDTSRQCYVCGQARSSESIEDIDLRSEPDLGDSPDKRRHRIIGEMPSIKILIVVGIVIASLIIIIWSDLFSHTDTGSNSSEDFSHLIGSDENKDENSSSNELPADSSNNTDSIENDIVDEEDIGSEYIDYVYRIDEWLRNQLDKSFEEFTDNERIIAYVDDDGEVVRVDAFPDSSYTLYRSFFYKNGELVAAIYSDYDDTENHVFYLEDGSLICISSWNYDLEQYENSFSQDEWGKWPGYLFSHSDQYWEAAKQLVYADNTSTEEDTNNSDFVLPNSSSEYLSMEDLEGLTKNDSRIARNEVYARHGRKFKDKVLQEYFSQFDWYNPTIEPDDFNDKAILSELERKNLDLILEYERIHGYR